MVFLLIINRQLQKSHKLKLSQRDNFQFLAFFTQEVYNEANSDSCENRGPVKEKLFTCNLTHKLPIKLQLPESVYVCILPYTKGKPTYGINEKPNCLYSYRHI